MRADPSLELFRRTVTDLEGFSRAQDVPYVGGGNTAHMPAVWRHHEFDIVLRRDYENGAVPSGRPGRPAAFTEMVVRGELPPGPGLDIPT
ncbi:Type 1 glutamine amidotransferase-like domain-containing protein [Specibacter cremeus]|uniref:Type 1 glutamine amidotransferase-like domain-containing protein n=1 Tax=Specibacter cremeus TaxID=1629051 RepID=UPI000F7762E7